AQAGAVEQGARHRRGGRLGGGRDAAQSRRRPLAGSLQALDRGRAQRRGRPRLRRGPARCDHRRGRGMSALDAAPRAARPFIGFVTLLRANRFLVAPEQTMAFLAAVSLLGPRAPEDIRQAGLATLAPPPERHAAYNLLFRIHFLGEETPAAGGGGKEGGGWGRGAGWGGGEPPEGGGGKGNGGGAARGAAAGPRRCA